MAEQTSNNKGMKWFILIMFMLSLVGMGATWFLYEKKDRSVKTLRKTQVKIFEDAANIKYFYGPSLSKYYDLARQGLVNEEVSDLRKSETRVHVENLLYDVHRLSPQQCKVDFKAPDVGGRKQDFIDPRVKIRIKDVTRKQYERILQDVRKNFNNYATLEMLQVTLETRGSGGRTRSSIDYSQYVNEDSLKWAVNFDLVWYDEKPAGSSR